ncbi:hypothetical protein ACIPSE_28345 [Streptomyces sp. NPDC090106]|uniref:hypothetical protein n=1 Tax=Streptomyces sp. NPDC090106 TaxID=3365946 RepID=UPI0037FD4F8B
MTRWSAFGRRRGSDRRGTPDRTGPTGSAPREGTAGAADQVLVEDYDGLLLLRSPSDDSLTPADIGDLARGQRSDDGAVTLIAGTESVAADSFWPRLSHLLDTLSDSGTETVRLAMAGAGQDSPQRPATARRIADAWGLKVEAPDGAPLLVPGGTLFVPGLPVGSATDAGWWRFAPETQPRPLGPRSPAPSWQSALRALPARTGGGCVVEQIPAGVLIRPAEAAPTKPGDLYHSVPVSPGRLAVVVGVPYGEDVLADDVADVLSALPEGVRTTVRLAPGGRRDLLSLAQSVADRLDTEVELMTGLPLIAAGRPLGAYSAQSVLVGADRTPRWLPFVDAVLCRPARGAEEAPEPRPLRWTPPLAGAAQPSDGVFALSDQWQVTVTRAGLWVGSLDGPDLSATARQVSPSGPLVEVGLPGERLDPTLWPALSGLLGALLPALRASVTLHVHGTPHDGGRELRRLAAAHGLRTIRFATFSPSAPAPREENGPPQAISRPRTSSDPDRSEFPAPVPAPAPARSQTVATAATGAAPTRTPRKGSVPEGAAVATAGSSSTGTPAPAPAAPRRTSPGRESVIETVRRAEAEAEAAAAGTTVGERLPGGTAAEPETSEPTRNGGAPEGPVVAERPEEPVAEKPEEPVAERPEEPVTEKPEHEAAAPDPEPGPEPGPAPLPDPDPLPAPAAPRSLVTTGSAPEPATGEIPDGRPEPSPAEPEAAAAPETEGTAKAEETPGLQETPKAKEEAAEAAGTPEPDTGADPSADGPGLPEPPLPQSVTPPPVPFSPGHRSTEGERNVFRGLADAEWDRHGTAVARALARMPALRGKEQEAARADLIALRLYLHDTEGPLSHQALGRALDAHDGGLLPYVACLASGLNRLPSYRGVVLRATAGIPDGGVPRPGALLRDAAPVSATPLDPVRPSMTTGASYVIWSVGARRVRQLLDPGDGPEEVVFTPGTLFRVLDVRRAGRNEARQIFLRELPGSQGPVRPDPEGDRAALARLDEAVRGRSAPAGAEQWPERCSGPFGAATSETTANH